MSQHIPEMSHQIPQMSHHVSIFSRTIERNAISGEPTQEEKLLFRK
jgi:hypothetical protein